MAAVISRYSHAPRRIQRNVRAWWTASALTITPESPRASAGEPATRSQRHANSAACRHVAIQQLCATLSMPSEVSLCSGAGRFVASAVFCVGGAVRGVLQMPSLPQGYVLGGVCRVWSSEQSGGAGLVWGVGGGGGGRWAVGNVQGWVVCMMAAMRGCVPVRGLLRWVGSPHRRRMRRQS